MLLTAPSLVAAPTPAEAPQGHLHRQITSSPICHCTIQAWQGLLSRDHHPAHLVLQEKFVGRAGQLQVINSGCNLPGIHPNEEVRHAQELGAGQELTCHPLG